MKNDGLILWNTFANCEMFRTSWQMVKYHMKGHSEIHFKVQRFHVEQGSNIIRFLQKGPVKISPMWQGKLTRNVLRTSGMHWLRVETGKEIFRMQTLGSWRIWTRQNPSSKTQCKGSVDVTQGWIFPQSKMKQQKLFVIDHEFREPALRREQSVRSKDLSEELQDELEGFQTDRN